jgi:hypothetical protein
MRTMARISMPAGPGSRAISDGTVGKLIGDLTERWQPEAMYFTATDGQRTVYLVFDLADTADIPPFAEPLFSGIEAKVDLWPVMNIEDLQRGLSRLG